MKVFQTAYVDGKWNDNYDKQKPDIIFCFGNKEVIIGNDIVHDVVSMYPNSIVITASTAGEIHNFTIQDNTVVVTGVEFTKGSKVVAKNVNIEQYKDSYTAGVALGEQANIEGLKLLFIISDGQLVNGGDLVNGLHSVIKQRVPVSGGLAGDGTNFRSTIVGLNNDLRNGNVIAIGFYGDNLHVGVGSKGGWDKFGP
ncbi:MAG TPA: FIST N-terminal domain-containing protein, partial [Candidatus Kapabacteria bacterium]|nr:FIST N-terminal domain-containing protein [Candidatus Kapabacteria bacterium]